MEDILYTGIIVEESREALLGEDGYWTVTAIIRHKRTSDGINWENRSFVAKSIDKSLVNSFITLDKSCRSKLKSCNGNLFNDNSGESNVEN